MQFDNTALIEINFLNYIINVFMKYINREKTDSTIWEIKINKKINWIKKEHVFERNYNYSVHTAIVY